MSLLFSSVSFLHINIFTIIHFFPLKMHVMCTLYYSPPSFLDCLRAASLMSSWSGVSYARITSSRLFTGVTNWEAWKRKWALCSSLSLSLCDLLQDNSLSESAFFPSVSVSCFSFSNCKISNRCLVELVSLPVPFVPLAFFVLPLPDFFLGPSRAKRVSSPSNCVGNWGDTYKKSWSIFKEVSQGGNEYLPVKG